MPVDGIHNMFFGELKDLVNIKYSYKVIATPDFEDISENVLNEFSENGWELVSITDNGSALEKQYKMVFRKVLEVSFRETSSQKGIS